MGNRKQVVRYRKKREWKSFDLNNKKVWRTVSGNSAEINIAGGEGQPYKLFTANGQLIEKGNLVNGKKRFHFLAPGIYIARIFSAEPVSLKFIMR